MYKWEYLFVQPKWHETLTDVTPRVFALNGNQVQEWKKGPHLFEYIAQLREQSWELVVFASTEVYKDVLVFKRAKQ